MVRVYSTNGMHDYVDIKDGVSYSYVTNTCNSFFRVYDADSNVVASVPYGNVFVIQVI